MSGLILFTYGCWMIVGTIIYMVYAEKGSCALEYYGLVTKYAYDNSEMNIVGCVIVALITYIAFPVLFIPRSIGMFIYWLLHIGRK